MSLFRLIGVFFRIGAMNEMQYRVNFLMQLLQSLIALGTGLIALALVFSHTTDLAGWSRPELLAVMGVHILMGGLIMSVIQPNMERLAMEVQDGTLDYALTKPEDAQVLISVREIRIWQTVDIIIGLIVLIVAVIQLGGAIGISQALGFALALLMGGVMIYSFWLMLTSTAFWVVRIHEMVSLFQGIYQAGRWPVSIYPNWLQIGLTFLVPLAFAVTAPAEVLTGRLTLPTLGLAAVLTVVLFVLARFVWRLGLRAYSGASA
jgi:ABC-2 type transport system permease protein